MAWKKGTAVRARRELGDVVLGYVRRRSVGVIVSVHPSWGGRLTKYRVQFSGRTLDSLTEGDIVRAK